MPPIKTYTFVNTTNKDIKVVIKAFRLIDAINILTETVKDVDSFDVEY